MFVRLCILTAACSAVAAAPETCSTGSSLLQETSKLQTKVIPQAVNAAPVSQDTGASSAGLMNMFMAAQGLKGLQDSMSKSDPAKDPAKAKQEEEDQQIMMNDIMKLFS